MHLFKVRLTIIQIALLALLSCSSQICLAQAMNALKAEEQFTNAIPTNVYVTETVRVDRRNSAGEMLFSVGAINQAEKLPESRPAELDPDGHWGEATNGLQVSLRFEKKFFTNGEPVVATLLLRNVTNSPARITIASLIGEPSPVNVLAFQNKAPLPMKLDGFDEGRIITVSLIKVPIYQQTQHKFQERLDRCFDFKNGGEFTFQAVYLGGIEHNGRTERIEVASQKVQIEIGKQ
jgi:hypothetical protein